MNLHADFRQAARILKSGTTLPSHQGQNAFRFCKLWLRSFQSTGNKACLGTQSLSTSIRGASPKGYSLFTFSLYAGGQRQPLVLAFLLFSTTGKIPLSAQGQEGLGFGQSGRHGCFLTKFHRAVRSSLYSILPSPNPIPRLCCENIILEKQAVWAGKDDSVGERRGLRSVIN